MGKNRKSFLSFLPQLNSADKILPLDRVRVVAVSVIRRILGPVAAAQASVVFQSINSVVLHEAGCSCDPSRCDFRTTDLSTPAPSPRIDSCARSAHPLQSLESAGISMEQVTSKLLADGVKAFADSFDSLLENVESKRASLLTESRP